MQTYLLLLEISTRLGMMAGPLLFILLLPVAIPVMMLLVYLRMKLFPQRPTRRVAHPQAHAH